LVSDSCKTFIINIYTSCWWDF